jgi:hypothetical protein
MSRVEERIMIDRFDSQSAHREYREQEAGKRAMAMPYDEARARVPAHLRIGARVQTLVSFFGMPKGSIGVVDGLQIPYVLVKFGKDSQSVMLRPHEIELAA